MSSSKDMPLKNFKQASQKSSKFKTSNAGSSYELRISIIYPKSDSTIGAWKYSIGDFKILYPLVDPETSDVPYDKIYSFLRILQSNLMTMMPPMYVNQELCYTLLIFALLI